jgi:flagellar biosynthesis/type III secretory pathway protein FliH
MSQRTRYVDAESYQAGYSEGLEEGRRRSSGRLAEMEREVERLRRERDTFAARCDRLDAMMEGEA